MHHHKSMFHSLQRKMTLLYTFTTGMILTVVVIAVLLFSEQLLKEKSVEAFQSSILTITSKIQSDSSVTHSWLSSMEADNNLIIHLEDNGTPLLYRGSWTPPTDRELLVQKAKETARKENVDTSITPISSSMQKTKIFRMYGEDHDLYQGIVIKYPSHTGYISLILLNSLASIQRTVFHQRLFFILLDILGIAALFFVSWKFTGKSLEPIQENQKKQTEFIAAASHELRSPLAVIQASAEAILQVPAQAEHLTQNICSECKRMSRLIQDMLSLASADASSWSIHPEALDMDTLLLDTYELYETICRDKQITLSLLLPEQPLPSIQGDRERLLQLLSILLDNAVSYSGQHSTISLQAEETKHSLSIAVIDHGPGIPDSEKALVFERFYRTDKSRNDKSHFGLGLSIAQELAHLHKGNLSVSDTEGGGCTFILKLPAVKDRQ